MTTDLLITGQTALIPAPIAAAGPDAVRRFVEFFTATIRNPNSRGAYARAIADFFDWCQSAGLNELRALEPVHVATYVEQLGKTHASPQRQAAPRGRSYAL